MKAKEQIRCTLQHRLEKKLDKISPLLKAIDVTRFYIAGGIFNPKHNDYDIYPVANGKLPSLSTSSIDEIEGASAISFTKNADTVSYKDEIVQFCHYNSKNLKDLVESFDFGHIKVGAEVEMHKAFGTPKVKKIYMSDDYIVAKATNNTFFTGSEYPLGSLIRILKFYKRGEFAGNAHMGAVIATVAAIAKRGFSDYEDFKDQLDAIDLGMLPENLEDVDIPALADLFLTLGKNLDDKNRMQALRARLSPGPITATDMDNEFEGTEADGLADEALEEKHEEEKEGKAQYDDLKEDKRP